MLFTMLTKMEAKYESFTNNMSAMWWQPKGGLNDLFAMSGKKFAYLRYSWVFDHVFDGCTAVDRLDNSMTLSQLVEKARQAFERWGNAKGAHVECSWNGRYYENKLVDTSFQGWQAGRESLVREIAEGMEERAKDYDGEWRVALRNEAARLRQEWGIEKES